MLTSTTPTIAGREITETLGVVTGEAIVGANIFRDLLAGITDIVGGRSRAYESALRDAREIALGVSSVGVTMFANSRMGYWEFANVTRGEDEVVSGFRDVGGVGVDDDGPSRDGRVRGGPSSTFG